MGNCLARRVRRAQVLRRRDGLLPRKRWELDASCKSQPRLYKVNMVTKSSTRTPTRNNADLIPKWSTLVHSCPLAGNVDGACLFRSFASSTTAGFTPSRALSLARVRCQLPTSTAMRRPVSPWRCTAAPRGRRSTVLSLGWGCLVVRRHDTG